MVVPCRVSATRRAIRRSRNLGFLGLFSAEIPWDNWRFNHQRYGDVENDLKMTCDENHESVYKIIWYYIYMYIIDCCCIYVSPCVSIPFYRRFHHLNRWFSAVAELGSSANDCCITGYVMVMSKFRANPSISSLEKKQMIPCPNILWSQSVESHASISILLLPASWSWHMRGRSTMWNTPSASLFIANLRYPAKK